MVDLDSVGGIPIVMRELLDAGLLHGDCMTVTGRTVAENLEEVRPLRDDDSRARDILRTVAHPLSPAGNHMVCKMHAVWRCTQVTAPKVKWRIKCDSALPISKLILRGNMAEESAVLKLSGKIYEAFVGPAMCFDDEDDAFEAIVEGRVAKGVVMVIRYEGPKGAPGMPEMLSPGAALVGAGLGKGESAIS